MTILMDALYFVLILYYLVNAFAPARSSTNMASYWFDIIQARESQTAQPAVSLGKLREEIVVEERLREDEISKSVSESLSRSSAFTQEAVCCPA